MKTPRDITANDLIKALKPFGYEIFRQKEVIYELEQN
jgi:biotin operon repressor